MGKPDNIFEIWWLAQKRKSLERVLRELETLKAAQAYFEVLKPDGGT